MAIWALVPGLYCFFGLLNGWWHPHWVIFFLIPIYYVIFDQVDRCILKSKGQDEEEDGD